MHKNQKNIWLGFSFGGLLLCFSPNISAKTPENWLSYNHADTTFEFVQSQHAQEGDALSVLDGSKLDFSKHRLSRYMNIKPQGFLYQTVAAGPYIGKHLHVSAFARNKAPNFEALEQEFGDAYLKQLEDEIDERLLKHGGLGDRDQIRKRLMDYRADHKQLIFSGFSSDIRESYANAKYGIWVVLHTQSDCSDQPVLELYEPTSIGNISSPELWHRFNVEISVPLEAKALSIIFWSTGVAISEVDHFAVVEHGPALNNVRASRNLNKFYSLYSDVRIKHIPEQTVFQNLSFEY